MSRTWHHQPWLVRARHPLGTPRGLPDGERHHHYFAPPSPVMRRVFWYQPERAYVRRILTEAVLDWQTNRGTDPRAQPLPAPPQPPGRCWWDPDIC